MTEVEAIKQLKMQRTFTYGSDAKVLGMAIKALEKQIPKKIAKYDVCPVCNNNQSATWYYVGSSYCEICGQKLDWRKEE